MRHIYSKLTLLELEKITTLPLSEIPNICSCFRSKLRCICKLGCIQVPYLRIVLVVLTFNLLCSLSMYSGKCYDGKCVDFCTIRGQIPCVCEQEVDSCRRCCKSAVNAVCQPFSADLLQDGRPCYQGYCLQVTQKSSRIVNIIIDVWIVDDAILACKSFEKLNLFIIYFYGSHSVASAKVWKAI